MILQDLLQGVHRGLAGSSRLGKCRIDGHKHSRVQAALGCQGFRQAGSLDCLTEGRDAAGPVLADRSKGCVVLAWRKERAG